MPEPRRGSCVDELRWAWLRRSVERTLAERAGRGSPLDGAEVVLDLTRRAGSASVLALSGSHRELAAGPADVASPARCAAWSGQAAHLVPGLDELFGTNLNRWRGLLRPKA